MGRSLQACYPGFRFAHPGYLLLPSAERQEFGERAGLSVSQPNDNGSFDHFVGDREQLVRYSQAERLRSLEVDHELELGRGLDGKVARLRALQDAIGIDRRSPKMISRSFP